MKIAVRSHTGGHIVTELLRRGGQPALVGRDTARPTAAECLEARAFLDEPSPPGISRRLDEEARR